MRKVFSILLCLFALTVSAREEQLVSLLRRAAEREQFSPDSVEQDIDSLEHLRLGRFGMDRALVDICLGRMYSENTYDGVEEKWMARSAELFREALSFKDELHAARTKDYRNLVLRGRNEKIYSCDMLYVAWRTMRDCLPDSSVMSEDSLIRYYVLNGNLQPEKVKASVDRLNHLNDSISRISPSLSVRLADAYYPGDSLRLDIRKQNIESTSFLIRNEKGKVVSRNNAFAPEQTGRYTIVVTGTTNTRLRRKPEPASTQFVVSRLQMLAQIMPDDSVRVIAVDAKSGKPVPEARVIFDKEKRYARVTLDADSCLPKMNVWGRYRCPQADKGYKTVTRIYTDRSIYRPGQQVQLSAIVYQQKHWDVRAKVGQTCTAQLLDANGKILESRDVVTDSLGTAATVFTLPKDIQLGYAMVRMNGQNLAIRVEEYKRPEFYVTVSADSLQITGQAMNYNGTPLRAARVTGTLRRVCCWWWKRQRNAEVTHLDTTYTDMDGRFSISIPRKAVSRAKDMAYFPHMVADISVLSSTGEEHSESQSLRLFDDPKQPEGEAPKKLWVECPVDSFDRDVPARIEFRQQDNSQRYIFVTGFSDRKVVIDTMLVTTDTLVVLTIPYEARYQDGIYMNAAYVQDGTPYHRSVTLFHKLPDNHLQLHWDTFRDHTEPGSMQQWTMRITKSDGRPARANLMLSVYDASLDALRAYSMDFAQPLYSRIPYATLRHEDPFRRNAQSMWQSFEVWYYKVPTYDFSRLNDELFGSRRYVTAVPMRRLYMTKEANILEAVDGRAMLASPQSVRIRGTEAAGEVEARNDVALRTDFSETALFRPQLRTDADGKVAVSFRLPQSLTRWHIKGLAHTVDMCFGMIDDTLQVRQALMAQLHLPRFLREGDHATYTATVSNNSRETQNGKVLVTVRDAKTQKGLKLETRSLKLASNRDTTYTFRYYAPQGVEGLCISISAKGRKDSDGEQREIPILSSLTELTMTEALTLKPGESREVDIQQMFPAMATDKRVIVEQNQDPVQTAVNTLPTVVRPDGKNALSYAAAYYAAAVLDNEMALPYISRLAAMQNADGSMSWYAGMYANDWITRKVGYLLVRAARHDVYADKVLTGIQQYLTDRLQESIKTRQKSDGDWNATEADLETLYILLHENTATAEQKALARKVLKHVVIDGKLTDADFLATLLVDEHDLKEMKHQDEALTLLRKQLLHTDGTYIAYRSGNYPGIDSRIETHTRVMEALWTVTPDDTVTLRRMQHWLLQQKRTQQWNNPVSSIDAIFALAKGNHDVLRRKVEPVKRDTIDILRQNSITVRNRRNTENWTSVYATYTLPQDQVDEAGNHLTVKTEIVGDATPKVGDHVTLRTTIKADLDYSFVEVAVPRPAGLEPVQKYSGLDWSDGVQTYRQIADDRTTVSITALPHGTYIINEECLVQREGEYSTGVPTVKCVYALEYQGHGGNGKLKVKN